MDGVKQYFIKRICPRPDHFCNGTALKDRDKKDLDICQYYEIDKGCLHPGRQEHKRGRKKG